MSTPSVQMRHMSDWQVPQKVPAIGIDIVGWLLLLLVSPGAFAADGLSVKDIFKQSEFRLFFWQRWKSGKILKCFVWSGFRVTT